MKWISLTSDYFRFYSDYEKSPRQGTLHIIKPLSSIDNDIVLIRLITRTLL